MGEYSPWSIIGKPTEIVVDIDELRVTEGERVYITIVDGKLAPSSLESSNCNITIVPSDQIEAMPDDGDLVVLAYSSPSNKGCSLQVTYKLRAQLSGTFQIASGIDTERISLVVYPDHGYYECRIGACVVPDAGSARLGTSLRGNTYETSPVTVNSPYGSTAPPRHGTFMTREITREGYVLFRAALRYGPGHLFTLYQNTSLIILTLGIERFLRYLSSYLTSVRNRRVDLGISYDDIRDRISTWWR